FWTMRKIDATAGKVTVSDGAQEGGRLHKVVKIGRAPFITPDRGNVAAKDEVFSSGDGSRYDVFTQAPSPVRPDPGTARGGVSHLDEFEAYRKQAGDASLSLTISRAIIDTAAAQGQRPGSRGVTPKGTACPPNRRALTLPVRAS